MFALNKKYALVIPLIAVLVVMFLFSFCSNQVYAEESQIYDTIPTTDSGNGELVHAEQVADSNYLVKVPYGTTSIKIYNNGDFPRMLALNDEFDQVFFEKDNCFENGWWTIDLTQLTSNPNAISGALNILKNAGKYVEGAIYKRVSTYEEYGTGLTIQIGDDNNPLSCYATNTEVPFPSPEFFFSDDKEYSIRLWLGRDSQQIETEQTIWYTDDGSDPTTSSTSRLYEEPVSITNTCIIKAVSKTSQNIWGDVSEFNCSLKPYEPNLSLYSGTYFGKINITMSTATDGADIYYTIDGSEPTEDSNKYTEPIVIQEDTILQAIAIRNGVKSDISSANYKFSTGIDIEFDGDSQGVFLSKLLLNSESHKAKIVTPYNSSECKIKLSINEGIKVQEVKCGSDVIKAEKSGPDKGKYKMTLSSGDSPNGIANIITITGKNSAESIVYTVTCVPQLYDDLPNSVVDFLSVASQYTNNLSAVSEDGGVGLIAPITLIGNYGVYNCASTGNFGGYITWYYEDGVENASNNPYGIDFIIIGNSFDGTNAAAEPGNILISENGSDWYTLAGSIHYDSNTVWNQEVTYYPQGESSAYSFKNADEGISRFQFPLSFYYPLHASINMPDFTVFNTKGTLLLPDEELNDVGNIQPPYPAFGYADVGLSESSSNIAQNPYDGIVRSSGQYSNRITTNRNGDGCDISWAVDDAGNPVKLDKIHYIKVQTASFIDNGAIGEKSTEVCCMRVAKAADSAVGVTTTPASIKIDGTEVQLKPGEVVDTTVDGIFDIAVDAPETTNVYINSLRSHTAFMDKAHHGIVRIIVQEGEKEPLIYYFKINQNAQQTTKKVTAVTFDTGKGLMQDKEKLTCYFDTDTIEHLGVDGEVGFPKAVSPKESEGFAYWYSENNEKQYTSYNADNATKLNGKTLTAVYGKADDVEAASAVAKAIEDLPDANALTIEDAEAVKAAQDAYDGLTGDQKKLVSAENKYKLALASATIGKLEAEASAADLQTQLDTVNGQLTAARNRVTELEGTVSTLQGQLETAQQDVRDAQARYDALKTESDADKAELAQAKADLETAKAAEKKAKDELDEAKGELTTAQGKVTELEGKVSSLQQDLAAEQAKAEAAQNDADKYEEELATLKAKNAILKKTVKKVKVKAKGTKAVVSWKSAGKGFTYEVYRSTDPAKTFKKVKTVKKLKTTVKKQKKGKTYYFKVRAFKKVGGKRVYTGYSNIVKVTIKK